jgi:hypothetical protein
VKHTAEMWGSEELIEVKGFSEMPPCAFKSARFIIVLAALSWAVIGGILYVAVH